MHPKKVLPKKPIFKDLGKFSIGKIVFWQKLFLGALFTKVLCTFLKSVRKDGFFDAPFDLFKEKKFSSLRRDNELFWELKKVKNGRNRSKFRKTVFYKQILDFHCPSKILCHTSKLWNFVKITGPYCARGTCSPHFTSYELGMIGLTPAIAIRSRVSDEVASTSCRYFD